jgi:uncharacterized surface protein with fasciclin (FAS1) repeats
MSIHSSLVAMAIALVAVAPVHAQGMTPPSLGGSPMNQAQTLAANLARSKDHTTLVAALKAADMGSVLEGPGPFTLFAPTNAAFEALPAGTLDSLLQPANKAQLQAILKFHVVPGRLTAANLLNAAVKGKGTTSLTTAGGGTLTGRAKGPNAVFLVDGAGNEVNVTQADSYGSNGVIHVVDRVMLPGK